MSLNERQQNYCLELYKTGNQVRSYMKSFDQENYAYANVASGRLMRNDLIIEYLNELKANTDRHCVMDATRHRMVIEEQLLQAARDGDGKTVATLSKRLSELADHDDQAANDRETNVTVDVTEAQMRVFLDDLHNDI